MDLRPNYLTFDASYHVAQNTSFITKNTPCVIGFHIPWIKRTKLSGALVRLSSAQEVHYLLPLPCYRNTSRN